jgi:hypothetical protein
MTRPSRPTGFSSPAVAVASSWLLDAVAASLAIASVSLCLIVTITVLSNKLGAGLPIPAWTHFFSQFGFAQACSGKRDDPRRDGTMMKSPTALVTAALVTAILVAASLLIAAETRGDDTLLSGIRSSYNSAEPGLPTSESKGH